MNTLLEKELRLLLPVWAAAMLLAALPAWFFQPDDPAPIFAAFFGMSILAVASFGREFTSGTFEFLLVQPVPRHKLWLAKFVVLFCALSLVCLTHVASNLQNLTSLPAVSGAVALSVPVAIAGGFSSILLVRQPIPALAFAVLTPPAIVIPGLFIFEACDVRASITAGILLALLALYSALGILWSRHLFSHAQAAGWAGGGASFARLAFFVEQSQPSPTTAHYAPIRALLRKEFNLHFVTLVGMGGLFAIHLALMVVRHLYSHARGLVWEELDEVLVWFGMLWLLPPFLIAAASVADERRLGTMDAQFCLPVSRRILFNIKLLIALVSGGLLSAALLLSAEEFGAVIGVKHGLVNGLAFYFDLDGYPSLSRVFDFAMDVGSGALSVHVATVSILVVVFLALSMVAFFASTLATGVLEALGIGALFFSLAVAVYSARDRQLDATVFSYSLWEGPLIIWISLTLFLIATLWLAWRNFCSWHERFRIWRRNILGLATVPVVSAALTVAVFHRAWELVIPIDQAHQNPRFSLASSPDLIQRRNAIGFLFSDGRLWMSHAVAFEDRRELVGGQFIEGSTWATVAMPELAIIAIQKDGTLWYSRQIEYPYPYPSGSAATEYKKPIKMKRIGEDADWQKAVPLGRFAILLKKDGSLWLWGPEDETSVETFAHSGAPEVYWRHPGSPPDALHLWPGLDAFHLHRIVEKTSWTGLYADWGNYVHLKDAAGKEWVLDRLHRPVEGWPSYSVGDRPPPDSVADLSTAETVAAGLVIYRARPETGLRGDRWKTHWPWVDGSDLGLRDDGTIWLLQSGYKSRPSAPNPAGDLVQLGSAADWRALCRQWGPLGLKTDGTLWSYRIDFNLPIWKYGFGASVPDLWRRVDPHSDWVGIYNTSAGTLSLAADGSIWRWNFQSVRTKPIPWLPPFRLAASRHPQLIGNLFTDDPVGKIP